MDVHATQSGPSFNNNVSSTSAKKTLDLSDSGSEISDEGYKTSDNSKLAQNASPNENDSNGNHNNHGTARMGSMGRSRSMSTDEGELLCLLPIGLT